MKIVESTHWDTTSWVRVESGRTRFACAVTYRDPLWYVTDCVPQRRDPEPVRMLLAVRDWLTAEHGASEIIAIHPDFWDTSLAAAGADLLHRMVPMWLPLDDDLLLLHGKPLPDGEVVPLEATPEILSAMSTDEDRDNDLRVWQATLDGSYGPLIADASVQVVKDSVPRAAIAITEHLGTPLISHFVTAATERGTGLGRALLVESLKRLSAAGYVDCQLHVVEDNWIAHRLCRSVGFIQDRPTLRVTHLSREQAGDVQQ